MKTFQDCIDFATENPLCYLATVDGGEPRVRAYGMWFADQTGFYFQTAGFKDVPAQLRVNPNVEVCFYKHSGITGVMMRLCGEAEFIDDKELRIRALEDRPFLKTFGLTAVSPGLIIFRIAHGKAHFWEMKDNHKPKTYIEF